MRIAVTGVPCVGKTTVSKLLAKKLGYKYVSVNDLAERLDAYIGYDDVLQSKIVNMSKLKKAVNAIKEDFVLDGHFSHHFDVDVVVVLRCKPNILLKRLKKKYPKNEKKVRENLDAEILGVITSEVLEMRKKFFEVDVSKKKKEKIVEEILKKSKWRNNK